MFFIDGFETILIHLENISSNFFKTQDSFRYSYFYKVLKQIVLAHRQHISRIRFAVGNIICLEVLAYHQDIISGAMQHKCNL